MTLSFKTLSYVISSPRDNQAYYKGIDFNENDLKSANIDAKDKINIIYPFHQYGQYDNYNHSNSKYYIPASTIKGAIFNNEIKKILGYNNKTVMVDDAKIDNNDIVLKKLKKIQYLANLNEHSDLDNEKIPKYDVFFQNVALQMLKPNINFKCDVYYDNNVDFNKILNKVFEINNRNIVGYIKKINKYIDRYSKLEEQRSYMNNKWRIKNDKHSKLENNTEIIQKLKSIKKNLNNIKKKKKIVCIGGYKGFIRSLVSDENGEKIINQDSAFFVQAVDETKENSLLPYGIVEVEVISD